jgi:8-oxo-dGTP pyrophosphatase MutT (NUDIX family)
MGAGILPTTIHNNKLYFLFGKENKYEDSAPGFSDFGGGTDNDESYFETAIREAGEELTGFLGNDRDIRKLLKKYGTYNIDYSTLGHNTYRMHIFPFEYDELLPFYYNNNQRFLQKRLDPNVIQKSKIFEKEEIKWVCIDDLKKMLPKFRSYFRNIINIVLNQKHEIKAFISKKIRLCKGNSYRAHFTCEGVKKYNNKTSKGIKLSKKIKNRTRKIKY